MRWLCGGYNYDSTSTDDIGSVQKCRRGLKVCLYRAKYEDLNFCVLVLNVRVLMFRGVLYSKAAGQITEAFEVLVEEVRRRRDTLLVELETTHADRQTSLAHQADSLENLLLDLTNCCELTQNALRHGDETEV